jgi:hypothetical protein
VSRFLLALIHNFGVAIVISVFFAVARGPSDPSRSGAVDALPAAAANYDDSTVPIQKARVCDRPPDNVCRLFDTEPLTSAKMSVVLSRPSLP